MPEVLKKFVLKHTFKNVAITAENVRVFSELEEHFSVPWRMYICHTDESLSVRLECASPFTFVAWTIQTEIECRISNKKEMKQQIPYTFGNRFPNTNTCGWPKLVDWDEMKSDLLVDDDSLIVEIHVSILVMTGFYSDNFRSFDESMKEFSDAVLIVNGKKLYISKLYLSTHSTYFKSLLIGSFDESNKEEVTLTGVNSDDNQKLLELLYCHDVIDENSVEGILLIADMYDVEVAVEKCEEFLMNKTTKTLKTKLRMSVRYNLEKLKRKCLSEIKSIADIQSSISGYLHDMDSSITKELLDKALDFSQ